MNTRTEFIPVELGNGKETRIQVTMLGGEEDIAFKKFSFDDIRVDIEGITTELVEVMRGIVQKTAPKKFGVEIGVEIGVESGQLTAMIVKGTGTANLKITLEWEND